MNTRKVRAGMPAPDDIPWPEPEAIKDDEDVEMARYLGWTMFVLALLSLGVLLGFIVIS